MSRGSDNGRRLRRKTRAVYDRNADAYVRMTRDFTLFPGLEQEVAEFLDLVPPGLILDAGCGAGRDGSYAVRSGRVVICADSAFSLLKTQSLLASRVYVVCCDVVEMPFGCETFSGIIASGVLLHLDEEDCSRSLNEIWRILIPGGIATVSMRQGNGGRWEQGFDFPDSRWFSYYQPQGFARLCTDSGFIVQDVVLSGRQNWFSVVIGRPSD